MEPSKRERLGEFLRRLGQAPADGTRAGALARIRQTLDAVEDDLTTIPNDPERWQTDGRLYPPRDDSARAVRPGVTRYRSRGHDTWIGDNGAIEIEGVDGTVELDEPGADGKRVRDL